MNFLKKISLTVAMFIFLPLTAFAQDLGRGMLDTAAGSKGAGYRETEIESIIGTVISAVLALLGVIFLALIVYGGYMWLIARGDEGKVETAKDTISRAVIGLVIVLGAYAITYFIVNNLTMSTLK
jgi:hypothetical protein